WPDSWVGGDRPRHRRCRLVRLVGLTPRSWRDRCARRRRRGLCRRGSLLCRYRVGLAQHRRDKTPAVKAIGCERSRRDLTSRALRASFSMHSSALGAVPSRLTPSTENSLHHRTTGVSSMRQFAKNIVKFLKAEDGPTAVEYAVMLALIIVVCI